MHKIISKVFFILGLSIVSMTAFLLVTGPTFDKIVLNSGESTFQTVYLNETWNNGNARDTISDIWKETVSNNSSLYIDDEQLTYVVSKARGYGI